MKGKIRFYYGSSDELPHQELEIEISGGDANKVYRLMIDFGHTEADFGMFGTDDHGSARLEFVSHPELNQEQITDYLPGGKDVRGIQRIRIYLQGHPALVTELQLNLYGHAHKKVSLPL
ncbi:MAG: hypothetical protein RQ714_06725 [Nitrosomonas sp.]|nr:hypothetical protein [Nitrosomonas sp.]